jgi:hypothetical protein
VSVHHSSTYRVPGHSGCWRYSTGSNRQDLMYCWCDSSTSGRGLSFGPTCNFLSGKDRH